jgi:hypothetical protein
MKESERLWKKCIAKVKLGTFKWSDVKDLYEYCVKIEAQLEKRSVCVMKFKNIPGEVSE